MNGLEFAGVVAGDYDTYSQTINTMVGGSYTLDFLFSEFDTGPSGFVVTTSGGAGGVPQPALWTMVICGMGLVGMGLRRRMAAIA